RPRPRAGPRRHPRVPRGQAHGNRRTPPVSEARPTEGTMASDVSLDWLISVDDHILEPPDLWVDRVPRKDRDRAPRMVREGEDEYWLYEDKRMPTSGLSAVAGKSKEEFSPEALRYDEMRPGCYDP